MSCMAVLLQQGGLHPPARPRQSRAARPPAAPGAALRCVGCASRPPGTAGAGHARPPTLHLLAARCCRAAHLEWPAILLPPAAPARPPHRRAAAIAAKAGCPSCAAPCWRVPWVGGPACKCRRQQLCGTAGETAARRHDGSAGAPRTAVPAVPRRLNLCKFCYNVL